MGVCPFCAAAASGAAAARRGSCCVITFTSFSEFNKAEGGDIWLAIDERRPLACIAGI